jgi:uncharacterized membrane protein YfcA
VSTPSKSRKMPARSGAETIGSSNAAAIAGTGRSIGSVRLILIGLAAGFFSALFGVGGGILIVPLLLLVCRWNLRPATATSLAAIGITATAGTIVYVVHGDVRPVYAALVGIPAAAGALGGTALQQRLRTRTLSFLFAALLVGIAIRMLVQ